MTIQAVRPATSRQPVARRLVAAAVVAAIGIFAFSFAIGSFVVGSSARMPIPTEGQQLSLLAGVPGLVLLGFAHLLVATALAAGGQRVRPLATVALLGALVATATRVAMVVSGLDPSAEAITTQTLAIPVLASIGYAAALLLARAPLES